MFMRVRRPLFLICSIASLTLALAVSGCASKKAKAEGEDDGSAAVGESNVGDMTSDAGNAMGLQTVNYAYDSSILDSFARNKLKENAKILKDNTSLKVQIEGNTDERGGIQYNLALGERRANAAKAYLQDQGVDGDRMTTISYGKEKPLDPASSETAWAKNRRSDFRITSK